MAPRTTLRNISTRLRRHTGALVVDSFFRGLSRAGQFHPRAAPHRHDVEVIRDVPYLPTGLAEHRLDVYRPMSSSRPGAPLAPVVLYVHGGGFRILSKDTHWVMGLAYARRGYVVFNVSYRLAPRHPFPAAIEDVCRSLRWVAENARSYGGDPERLVFAGESAGGNLVTSLALTTSFRRPEPFAREVFELGLQPRAVVAACALLQVSDTQRFKRRWPQMSGFINDRLEEVTDAYLGATAHHPELQELADPLLVLEGKSQPDRPLPAFFAPCGTKDPLLDDTRRLQAALQLRGVPCEARFYPGELHAFHALVFRERARECWADTFQFLDRELGSPSAAVRRAS